MKVNHKLTCLLALPAALLAAHAVGQPDVPEPLEPWRAWVLYGQAHRACPVLNGSAPGDAPSHVCAWPGELSLEVDAARARFSQAWQLHAPEWVPLPGGAEHWPVSVTVDGRAQPAVLRGGRPAVRLDAGSYRVTGELGWVTRPASIPIPRETGLLALRLDGQRVMRPVLEGATLWLGLRPEAAVERDRLSVAVYRRLADGVPIELETLIELDVAGQSRELELDGALLPGFTGEALESDLPAQLDQNGTLRTQLRPGRWQLRLLAHAGEMLEQIAVGEAVAPWPPEEIWSFEAAPRLRVAALEGAAAADSLRSGVPAQWQSLPSYRVGAGQTLTVVERSRNDASEPNRLTLNRDLWLDFDGSGFTARDFVRGRMLRRWRLDMAEPYVMTMAASSGASLLITEGLEPGLQGVELRESALALSGTARLETAGTVPVTGYREQFDAVSTTLHLPPAYRLVAAPGADRAVGAWLERWRLLDVFLVLIITAAAWRLFGAAAGLIALAALVLAFQEPWAPRWAWLNLLVAVAWLEVAPEGWLRWLGRRYHFASVAALVLLLIPFVVGQLRVVVFPQLEHASLQRGAGSAAGERAAAFAPGLPRDADAGIVAEQQRLSASPDSAVEEITVTANRIGGDVTRYLPGALVQTGPGLPDWTWNRHTLGWNGPVEPGQSFRLVIFGPWLVGLWRVASVVAALALLLALLGRLTTPFGKLPATRFRHGAAVAALVLAALLPAEPGAAQTAGEFPSPALLEELRSRLTMPAPCHPGCAELTRAVLALEDSTLELDLELAVQDTVAVPIPGASAGWSADSISVDGSAVSVLYRGADGRAWLELDSGVHRAVLRGPIPPAGNFTVAFPLTPRRIEVAAPGWDTAGIVNGRLPSGALELIRAPQGDAADPLQGTVFPPFVRVTRSITFDLDWRVQTRVERVAPDEAAFTLAVDLLPSEAVITPDIEVANGRALAAFAARQFVVEWESRLPSAVSLTLSARAGAPWTERWRFTVGHIWHAEYRGLPSSPPQNPNPSLFAPEYYPRPGESLTVALTRPEPASGDTIAIDSVDYTHNVGARAAQSNLDFAYRSTRGTEHVLGLPAGSELESVRIDGRAVPLELEDGRLSIPVTPGEHGVQVAWRNAQGADVSTALPRVDLGAGASNLRGTVSLPADRWVLYTSGPTLGPAVLYWAELAIFALAAWVLGRLTLSPLRTHEWLLLGLGLSTFAWPVLLLFAATMFALSWRGRTELDLSRFRFNSLQLGLGVLAVAMLLTLVGSIPTGLLGQPDMQIASPVQFGALSWFADRSTGLTPEAQVVSVSLWFYKAAMLAWALWLSFALLRWLRWAWRAYTSRGIWRARDTASTTA